MRDYVFRGKPKNKNDYYFFSQSWKESCKDGFVYGSLVISKNKDYGDRYYICVTALCSINSCVNNGTTSMIEVIPETVGQYTGITDKNGKKIFGGDILKWQMYIKDTEEKLKNILTRIDEVVYKHTSFQMKNNSCSMCVCDDMDTLEVIGSIHDNPELLEQTQNKFTS